MKVEREEGREEGSEESKGRKGGRKLKAGERAKNGNTVKEGRKKGRWKRSYLVPKKLPPGIFYATFNHDFLRTVEWRD
jgi:hypothetical protein